MTHRSRRSLALMLSLLPCLALAPSAAGAVPGYAKVYEPDTSMPLAATVCWQAGTDAPDVATGEERPASMLVRLDPALRVLTEAGVEIATDLKTYLEATAAAVIPALRVEHAETAQALLAFLKASGRMDVFAAADWRDTALLKDLTNLPHVRGLVDFTSYEGIGEGALDEIVRLTNGAGAKVALLSEEMATWENVRALQNRLLTVWARAGDGLASAVGLLTRGVNGLVTADFRAADAALAFLGSDAPALLRVPRVIGHRGLPSEYVENTLPGARAALAAGADVIELDIYLSRDGQLYINHDLSLKRLFDRGDIPDSEKLTLAELQSIPFSFTGFNGVPAANNQPAAKSRYGTLKGDSTFRIPSLREYYEAFRGEDVMLFVEIKSHDTAVVSALKALCEEMGTADQTVVITFNTEILDAMRREWPEMSVGALGTEGANLGDGRPGYLDYASIAAREGEEKALELLYRVIGPWNATWNPSQAFTYAVAAAGRHRGLTVWPWTYKEPKAFAEAYLKGIYGLTTNFAAWGTDLPVRVLAGDLRLAIGQPVPLPTLLTRLGKTVQEQGFTLLILEGDALADGCALRSGSSLVLWRIRCALEIDGQEWGAYDLFSEPFRVSVE